MSDINLELATTDELINEIKNRFESFVFSGVLNEKRSNGIINNYFESKGNYYERLGLCSDLQASIAIEGQKEEE